MEDVLDVYHAPYDPQFPLVCMDESNKQLVGEVHAPLGVAPGRGQIVDHEYVRNGVAEIFLEIEPLTGRRHVDITERRTRKDWAAFVKDMLDERYPQATKVRLVMDNLNTHSTASLYETFAPEEARRLARRLEIHYTPKHGSCVSERLKPASKERNGPATRTCVSRHLLFNSSPANACRGRS